MASWSVIITIGATPTDITSLVEVPSIVRTKRLFTELRPNVNKCEFRCNFTSALWLQLISAATVAIAITKNGAAYFTGYVSPNFATEIVDGRKYITITAEDATLLKLGKTIGSVIALQGYKVCDASTPATSLVHYLATAAGVTLAAGLPTITTVIPYLCILPDDKVTYAAVLADLGFYYNFVYSFLDDGTLALVQAVNKGAVAAVGTFSVAAGTGNIRAPLGMKKDPVKYDDIRVKYSLVELKTGIVLFQDTSGVDYVNPCNIVLNPAGDANEKDYYPVGAKSLEVFSAWANPNGLNIWVAASAALDSSFEAGISLSRAFTNYYRKCSFAYRNTSGAQRKLTKLRITGDAYCIVAKNVARSTTTGGINLLEIEAKYIFDTASAQELARCIDQYYRYSDQVLRLLSQDSFNLGDYMLVQDSIYAGLTQKCRIVGKTNRENSATIAYDLEAVDDYVAVDITQEGNNTGAERDNGPSGYSSWYAYHDNPVSAAPAAPTGDGTTGGWHADLTELSVWVSVKQSINRIDAGLWSTPRVISALALMPLYAPKCLGIVEDAVTASVNVRTVESYADADGRTQYCFASAVAAKTANAGDFAFVRGGTDQAGAGDTVKVMKRWSGTLWETSTITEAMLDAAVTFLLNVARVYNTAGVDQPAECGVFIDIVFANRATIAKLAAQVIKLLSSGALVGGAYDEFGENPYNLPGVYISASGQLKCVYSYFDEATAKKLLTLIGTGPTWTYGGTFGAATNIMAYPSSDAFGCLAKFADGRVLLVYVRVGDAYLCARIRSAAGSWGAESVVAAYVSMCPAVATLTDGRIVCVYDRMNAQANTNTYERVLDASGLWSAEAKLSAPSNWGLYYRLHCMVDGRALMVYRAGLYLNVRIREISGAWGAGSVLSTSEARYGSLAALSDGSMICVYPRNTDGSPVERKRDIHGAWGPETLAGPLEAGSITPCPLLALPDSRVLMVHRRFSDSKVVMRFRAADGTWGASIVPSFTFYPEMLLLDSGKILAMGANVAQMAEWTDNSQGIPLPTEGVYKRAGAGIIEMGVDGKVPYRKFSTDDLWYPKTVYAHAEMPGLVAYAAWVPIDLSSITMDTAGIISRVVVWKLTAPISGFYQFSGYGIRSGGAGSNIHHYINNALAGTLVTFAINGGACAFSRSIYLNEGDFFDCRINVAMSVQICLDAYFIGPA